MLRMLGSMGYNSMELMDISLISSSRNLQTFVRTSTEEVSKTGADSPLKSLTLLQKYLDQTESPLDYHQQVGIFNNENHDINHDFFICLGRFNDIYDSNPLALMKYLLPELDKRNLAFVEVRRHNPSEVKPTDNIRTSAAEQIPDFYPTIRKLFKSNLIANDSISIEEAT